MQHGKMRYVFIYAKQTFSRLLLIFRVLKQIFLKNDIPVRKNATVQANQSRGYKHQNLKMADRRDDREIDDKDNVIN